MKVEAYTRSSFHFFAVLEIAAIGFTGLWQAEAWLALLLMVGVHGVMCSVTASRALDWTRGRRERPVRLLWTLGAITAAVSCAALAIAQYGPGGEDVEDAAGGVFGVVLIFGAGTIALGVRGRAAGVRARRRLHGRRRSPVARPGRPRRRRTGRDGGRAVRLRRPRLHLRVLRLAPRRLLRTRRGPRDPRPARRRRGTAAVRARPARRAGAQPRRDRPQERAGRAVGAARAGRGRGADDRGAADRPGVAARGAGRRTRVPGGRPRSRTRRCARGVDGRGDPVRGDGR